MADLHLAVCGEYVDAMKRGDKPEEYPQVNPYWSRRLIGRQYEKLIITTGYPRRDDAERRLAMPYRGYGIKTITHKHFGGVPENVFAINVTAAKE